MKVSFKKQGVTSVIVYTKGATLEQIVECLEKRVADRKSELVKREWIVKQYESIKNKLVIEEDWLNYLKGLTEEEWQNMKSCV